MSMARVTRKVWSRGARHLHKAVSLDVVDMQDHRADDRVECLWYPDCFEKAAKASCQKVCEHPCPKYTKSA